MVKQYERVLQEFPDAELFEAVDHDPYSNSHLMIMANMPLDQCTSWDVRVIQLSSGPKPMFFLYRIVGIDKVYARWPRELGITIDHVLDRRVEESCSFFELLKERAKELTR